MHASRLRPPLAALLCLFATSFSAIAQNTAASFRAVHGPQTTAAEKAPALLRHPKPGPDLRSWFLHWNEVAINASGLDHTQVEAVRYACSVNSSARSFSACNGDRSYRHVRRHDCRRRRLPQLYQLPRTFGDVSIRAAIAQAAHDTLVALYPSKADAFDAKLKESKGELTDSPRARIAGILLGKIAAAAILRQRRDDGAQHTEPVLGTDHTTSNAAGHWRQDPISRVPVALGAHWDDVEPFVIRSASQFRVPPPPAMTSAEYAEAFDEVKRLGGDGVSTPTVRTADQTFAGIYWAYDGTPSLCAPPRLYNQIAVTIAKQQNTDAMRTARLLTLVNVAMADAGIAIWESKYFYDFWRPVTGIRESDPGTGPTGTGDGNPATIGDRTFTPLGAPASNLAGPNFTPPFPSYPSGHAGFGGAIFQILRNFYRTDNIAFTFVSDEYNGVTRANDGTVRPLKPRSFPTLSSAEEENGQSRIYLGIHWEFDKTEGLTQGERVADYVFDRVYRPVR